MEKFIIIDSDKENKNLFPIFYHHFGSNDFL